MKLRTSFCNGSVLEKNITRFAPLWLGYSGFLILYALGLGGIRPDTMGAAVLMYAMLRIGTVCYGIACAVTLFGDLFSREHALFFSAMPLRRECWFITHVLSGVLFFLVPACVLFPMISVFQAAAVSVLGLDFIFSFGVSVLLVQLSGSRVGAVMLILTAMCIPTVVRWFIVNLYQQFLPSIGIVQMDAFDSDLETVNRLFRYQDNVTQQGILGAVSLVPALLIYRRKKVENAGTFGIIRGLRCFFAAIFALSFSCLICAQLDVGVHATYLLLALLVPILYVGGAMLAERKPNILRPGYVMTLGIFMLFLFGSFWMVRFDPLGRMEYVPQVEQVRSVRFYGEDWQFQYRYECFSEEGYTFTDPKNIERIMKIHRAAIPTRTLSNAKMFYLTYTMDDGSTLRRYYPMPEDTTEMDNLLDDARSSPEYIFGNIDWETYKQQVYHIEIQQWSPRRNIFVYCTEENLKGVNNYAYRCTNESMRLEFLDDIWNSADQGNLSQLSDYEYEVRITAADGSCIRLNVPAEASDVLYRIRSMIAMAEKYPDKIIN